MDYIVDPMSGISPLGSCSCKPNYGNVTNYSPCNKCTNNCSTLEICVTPTGAKMAPAGIKPKTEI